MIYKGSDFNSVLLTINRGYFNSFDNDFFDQLSLVFNQRIIALIQKTEWTTKDIYTILGIKHS
jgi:hypothetical protein